MNKKLLPILLILWCPASSIADSPNSIYIKDNDKSITLRVDDATLGKVLQSIEGKTGIQFHVSPSVLNDRITTNLNAPDWQTAMRQLLEPYGRAELWNTQLDLTEIYVLSRGDSTTVSFDRPPTRIEVTQADMRSSSTLHRNQLIKLSRGSLNKPLPPGLYNDPKIKEFLKQYGIQSPEGMKDTVKARTIRIKARKILLERDKAKKN